MAQAPIPDTWLKEFEEAMKLADDIAARLRERDLIVAAGGDPSHIVTSTRRKITVLGTCLDRLESLLQNPPAKPSVNEEELYQRQDMLLGIRFKTKQMAASFSTSQASNRVSHLGEGSGKETAEQSGTREGYGISSVSKQPIQDEDLARLERTAMGTKHMLLSIDEEMNLRTPFLDESSQEENASNPQSKGGEKTPGKEATRSCSFQLSCLVILSILVLLLVIWTVINIL